MQNEVIISLEEKLDILTFEILLSSLLKKTEKIFQPIDSIIFDMSKLAFVKLGGLISFLSLCGAIKEKRLFSSADNIRIYLQLPQNNVLEHLHWMQFFKISNIYGWIEDSENLSKKDDEYLEKWKNKLIRYQNETDPIQKKSYKAKFFPIHFIAPSIEFSNFDSICHNFINELIDVFEPILENDLNFSKEDRSDFWESNVELYKNIFDHSKSWGLLAVQVDKKNVVFSYSDIGIGIMNSLKEYLMMQLHYKANEINDCLAIQEAVKKGISSKSKNSDNMGLGLYLVTEYVKKTNGRMIIRSGKYLYSINTEPTKATKPKKDNYFYFPGTQIHIAIPINKY